MSSIGWKIEWNASGTRADVASLSSKKWNLGWGCPYTHMFKTYPQNPKIYRY